MSTDNNELESLFQRASENYPLNTDSANWNAVLDKLEKEGNKKMMLLKKRLLFVLILLGISMLSAYLMQLYINKPEENNNVIVPTLKEQKELDTNMLKKITDAVYEKIKDSMQLKSLKQIPIKVATLDRNNHTEIHKIDFSNSIKPKVSNEPSSPPKDQLMVSSNQESLTLVTKNASTNPVSQVQETTNVIDNHTEIVEAVTKPIMTDSSDNITSPKQISNAPIIKIKKNPFKKYFYTGLMYASDKSSINFEASKGMGYSMALVLGYQFSKRFSLESGIHIEKKEYYTKGEHFDKSILPATGKILWIESENKLIEIPLSLKTDLWSNQRHQIFGSFGISSFLVNNESYEYEEEVNGVIQSESVEFTKNSSNLFATTNISLGYEYKIKNRFRLRIEPYLNLPLSGIGKSKEHVLSKGVYFGLLYNFHKK